MSTSDPLATLSVALLLFVGAVPFLATLVVSVPVMLLEGQHSAGFRNFHVDVLVLLRLGVECLGDFGYLVGLYRVGEGNLENDEQVTELVGLFMVGHTMALNCLDFIWLDNLTGFILYSDLTTIKVS